MVRAALIGAAFLGFFINSSSAGEEKEEKDSPAEKYSGDCARSGCHEALKKQEFVHGPISLGQCGVCHKVVEGEEHKFQDTREEKELCTFCHELESAKKFVHKPFKPDGCMGCHDPHGGKVKGFLAAESLPKLCETCHTPKEMLESKHGPVVAGECRKCHDPHQSDVEKLLVAPERDMCTGCHEEVGKELKSGAHIHEPLKKGCTECHFGHTGPNPLLLKKPPKDLCAGCHEAVQKAAAEAVVVHGPLKSEDGCTACHAPHASASEAMIKKATMLDLCLSCHSKEISRPSGGRLANVGKEIAGAKFKHGPVAKGLCSGCHDPHSGPNVDLLVEKYPVSFYSPFKEEEYALCFTCHDKAPFTEKENGTTGFRSEKQNLHYLHVSSSPKGRTCRACHDVHASNFPALIEKDIPFGKGGWRLPIGFEKTAGGGKCSPGCHLPKTYDRPEPKEGSKEAGEAKAEEGKAAAPESGKEDKDLKAPPKEDPAR